MYTQMCSLEKDFNVIFYFVYYIVPSFPPNRVLASVSVRALNEALVTWSEVDSIDQNGNITQYEVRIIGEFDDTTRIESTDGETFSLVVTELEQATLYNISVRAHTSVGPGPYSDNFVIGTFGLFHICVRFIFYLYIALGIVITASPQSMNVSVNESVTFTCEARGSLIDSRTNIDWFYNTSQVSFF